MPPKKKKEITITCGLSATIPTTQYANIQPSYFIKQSVEAESIEATLETVRKLLKRTIDADYERVRVAKIKKQRSDIRITEKDGKQYPHVTSIIGAIEPIDYPEELLRQYGARGTLVHAQVEHFFRTQVWETDVLKIPGTKLDYLTMSQGSLGLKTESCNFMGFWEAHGKDFDIIDIETPVFNSEHVYTGRRDVLARYKGKLSICDIKTSSSYVASKIGRYWKQLAAYARCEQEIEQLVIIPLNPKKGFEKPIIETDIDKFFNLFLQDRQAFRSLYNL